MTFWKSKDRNVVTVTSSGSTIVDAGRLLSGDQAKTALRDIAALYDALMLSDESEKPDLVVDTGNEESPGQKVA